MFDMQNVGRKISSLRKQKNMTQMELADLMGISFQSVSNWERGNSMPDISKLPELAELFEVTVDELIGKESKLIESVIDGKTDEYINNNELSVSEIAEAAPVLKPNTVNEIIEKSKVLGKITSKLDKIENTIDLPEETNSKTIEKEIDAPSFSEIIPLFPFLEEDVLNDVARNAEKNFACSNIESILPFITEDVVNEIAGHRISRGESISSLLPFMSNDKIDEISETYISRGESISSLLPFMSNDKIDEISETYISRGESISSLLPFMSNDKIDKLAYSIFQKQGTNSITSFLPFMSNNMLNRIAKEAVEKDGFKSIEGIFPFLN